MRSCARWLRTCRVLFSAPRWALWLQSPSTGNYLANQPTHLVRWNHCFIEITSYFRYKRSSQTFYWHLLHQYIFTDTQTIIIRTSWNTQINYRLGKNIQLNRNLNLGSRCHSRNSGNVANLQCVVFACFRYLAICYCRHSKITSCASRTTIVSIWLYASVIMAPLAVFYQMYPHPDYPEVPICHQIWPNYDLQRGYFLLGLFFVCYVLPLLMILLCYLLIAVRVWRRNAPGVEPHGRLVIYKSKIKVLKMLAVIVILFAFSWLPSYAIVLRFYFGPESMSYNESQTINTILFPIAQWLGNSNCGMNPIIYCFFSKKYRRGFRKLIYCRLMRLRWRRHTRNTQSLSTRYVNVDNSSVNHADHAATNQHENRVSSNKYMVVAFNNGKMTVSFRKENVSDESSF